MPSWWGRYSSKDAKKRGNKESIIDAIHRKFKSSSEDNCDSRSGGSRRRCSDNVSDRGSLSRVPSRSTSPSTQVSRCQSFAERPAQRSHPQPLPLPRTQRSNIVRTDSSNSASLKSEQDRNAKPSVFPLPKPGGIVDRVDPADAEGDVATASFSSGSSSDSDDPTESRLLSPLTSDYENGNKTAINSPSSVMNKEPSPTIDQKNWKETFKPSNLQFNNQPMSTSPKKKLSSRHMQNLQIPPRAFGSAPDSSMSSPSRSLLRAFGAEQFVNSGFWVGKTYPDIASAHCSSPGSGHNSGHNSVGGDLSGQLFWQPSRCSPEYSPNPSPRIISPGPSSRIHSGAVTPLHPRASGGAIDSPTTRPDDGKQQSHPLPLPPLTITHSSPFSPTYSASTTPSVPRSPGRAENPTSPHSRWKKGRLLGRGTFGHVYLGFNSESGGEMCAMKEVTLFSDDAKSRESAQQLGQEIALLSRLQHPNIVQYYGSETVDDKLYIYLEYVSGGSIYKLLQEYGHFGEVAIRSYTQQILSGLAYLHNKHTVHRDIKGANILVDPSGRVKLADFGMAKHITGQSCPLSFKGSPYWMAPEVIKNSNGCNLAVDIWSLGCTVLEMATTKPPWSQYEGVAAMFKIGNSKELPAIPDHLSAEGKDFVLKCLQRNPANRPSASQLLEHPFVKNAAPLERPIISADTSEGPQAATTAVRSSVPDPSFSGIGNTRNYSSLESDWVGNYHSRGSKMGPGSSDIINIPRNISCPVSPIGSPLLHSRSPQHMSGRMSPSPISSPHAMSGASTPLSGGSGALPFHHPKHPATYHPELGTIPRRQTGFYTTGSSPYHDQKPELFRVLPQASQAFRDIISSENCTLRAQTSHLSGSSSELYDAQSVLADRLSAPFERPRKL